MGEMLCARILTVKTESEHLLCACEVGFLPQLPHFTKVPLPTSSLLLHNSLYSLYGDWPGNTRCLSACSLPGCSAIAPSVPPGPTSLARAGARDLYSLSLSLSLSREPIEVDARRAQPVALTDVNRLSRANRALIPYLGPTARPAAGRPTARPAPCRRCPRRRARGWRRRAARSTPWPLASAPPS